MPLFATVQEFAPTGANFNFGGAGFGIIGASIGGVNIIVWGVLAVFFILAIMRIYKHESQISVLYLAAIIPLVAAGMSEVKYLPHFGVAYILAFAAIIGELLLYAKEKKNDTLKWGVIVVALFITAIEAAALIQVIAANGQSCTQIANNGNPIGYDIFCNQVPQYWLAATQWMRTNVGPFAPRILSWWDYGDWINWFGNSNAVLRGDNAVATMDYAAAAQYVLGAMDGYNSTEMRVFANSAQAEYVLFDDQLIPKWGALDFLACVHANETSLAYAEKAGAPYGLPDQIGTSPCETSHDPADILIPSSTSNINNYCSISNSTVSLLKSIVVVGYSSVNQTYCVPSQITGTSAVSLYYPNGTKSNAVFVPTSLFYQGSTQIQGQQFLSFMLIYLPNGPNDTITDAPSAYYSSNFYKAFFFGRLPGFSLAYPSNVTGVNYVNSTNPIIILRLNNYTGGLPPVVPKPSYIHNNYTMPG